MEIGLILKIAGIGILVTAVSSILTRAGRDEQAMMITVGGIIVVMLMLIGQIQTLIEDLRAVFGL